MCAITRVTKKPIRGRSRHPIIIPMIYYIMTKDFESPRIIEESRRTEIIFVYTINNFTRYRSKALFQFPTAILRMMYHKYHVEFGAIVLKSFQVHHYLASHKIARLVDSTQNFPGETHKWRFWFSVFYNPVQNTGIQKKYFIGVMSGWVLGTAILLYMDKGVPVLSAGFQWSRCKCDYTNIFQLHGVRIAIKIIFLVSASRVYTQNGFELQQITTLLLFWLFLSGQAAYTSGCEHGNWTPKSASHTLA